MNHVSFYGGESCGSVAARRNVDTPRPETPIVQTPDRDTVNFRGRDYEEEKSSSFVSKGLKGAAFIALVIGGLGCLHKYDVVGKLKDGKVKDFFKKYDKITEPCHKWCSQAKEYAVKGYEKIKGWFKKS